MHVYKVLSSARLLLKGYVRTPETIVTGTFAVRLPDVSVLLKVHLVAIEGIGNGPSITGMPNGKSTLWISWRNWRRTSDGVPHGVCFALNVETVFVSSRGVDLENLLLLSVRIRWVQMMRHIGKTRRVSETWVCPDWVTSSVNVVHGLDAPVKHARRNGLRVPSINWATFAILRHSLQVSLGSSRS